MKNITLNALCVLFTLTLAGTAYADGTASKQSRTGSLEPVNAALRTNYGQVVSAAQVRSGISRQGQIVRAGIEVPTETVKAERVIIRRGPAVKLMNP